MASGNIWDRAGRFGICLDPPEFFEWVLLLPRGKPFFVGWEETRNIPFFTDPDRVRDLVARLDNLDAGGEPWAVITEVQAEPDSRMLGRVNVYGGSFWLEQRPDAERGSRFVVGALVVLLTGRGTDLASQHWQRAGLQSLMAPKVFAIGEQSAENTLSQIESGALGLAVLSWIPLMQGGDQASIIEQWKSLGQREPDAGKKSNLAALAQLFSEKAGCAAIWKEALKEWNVEESTIFKEWTKRAAQLGEERGREIGERQGREIGERQGREIGERQGREIGERQGMMEMATVALKQKFGDAGEAFAAELAQLKDLDQLRSLALAVYSSDTLDELRELWKPEW